MEECLISWSISKEIFIYYYYLKILFILEGKGEKNQCVRETSISCLLYSRPPTTGDLACSPGMCPDWELNWWPLGSQVGAQATNHTSQGKRLYCLNSTVFHVLWCILRVVLQVQFHACLCGQAVFLLWLRRLLRLLHCSLRGSDLLSTSLRGVDMETLTS